MGGMLLSLRALTLTGVPVRSAPEGSVEAALDLLALEDGERFCDLGAGHGNVLAAARARADVQAEGFELNPWIALLARLRCLGDRKVKVRCRDSRHADLSGIAAFYAYLMPKPMAELATTLERLAPGTRIVSVDFPIPGFQPLEIREIGPLRQPVMLYVIGRHRP